MLLLYCFLYFKKHYCHSKKLKLSSNCMFSLKLSLLYLNLESATESLKNIEVPAEKNDKVSLVFHDNGLSDSSSKRKSIDSYVSESESETKRLKHSGILFI